MMVLYAVWPSFFESCALSPPTPITAIRQRSTCFVRSPLAIQLVPPSNDLNKRFPPRYMMLGLCEDRMYGVFQLKRYVSPPAALITFARPPPRPPPPPPPPPPRPPPGARPSTHV